MKKQELSDGQHARLSEEHKKADLIPKSIFSKLKKGDYFVKMHARVMGFDGIVLQIDLDYMCEVSNKCLQ